MKKATVIEQVITVLILLFYTGGPLTVIVSNGFSQGDPGSPEYPYINEIFQGVYLITLLLLAFHWKRALSLLLKDKFTLLLLGISAASTLWSTAPGLTAIRSIAIIGTTLFAVYLAARYSLKERLQLLGWTFGLAIALSFLYIIFLPHFGVMGALHAGAWRGIYTHKNGLGSMMNLGALCFFLLTFIPGEKKHFALMGLGLSTCLMMGSRASSPLINLLIGITAFFVSRLVRLPAQIKLSILFSLIAFGCISMAVGNDVIAIVTGGVGKDVTFTGRTELWGYVWDMIVQRPWLGYGYSALWLDESSESVHVWKGVGWEAPNAHNGFLEIWLGIGLIGLCAFVVHLLINLFRSLALIQHGRSAENSLPFLLILLTLIASITESYLLARNGIYWVLYVALTLDLAENRLKAIQHHCSTIYSYYLQNKPADSMIDVAELLACDE